METRIIILFVCIGPLTAKAQSADPKPSSNFIVAQYAGSIGYASLGIGHDFNSRMRLSLHYGHVPLSKGGPLDILATKFFFSPMIIKSIPKIVIKPIDLGVLFSYHFGRNFYTSLPNRYPDGYYWWKSSLKFHMAVESSVTYTINRTFFKSITGYVEFNTNELYSVSYVQNPKSLHLSNIIKMGLGTRLKF